MVRVRNLDFLEFPGYEVDTEGNVWSLNYARTGERRMLSPGSRDGGYLFVTLFNKGRKKEISIHQLVARAFKGDWSMLGLQVNHKDENKQNNNVSNIEWCSAKFNSNWGTRNERISKANKGKTRTDEQKKKFSKPILGINIKTGDIIEFYSISEASRTLNISDGNIGECCKGRRKSCGGYIWRYYDSDCCSELDIDYVDKTAPKKVSQYTKDGSFIKSFKSALEAEKITGVYTGSICACCKGKRKTAGGYIWRYKTP